jgi:hypothetical protein
MSGNSLTVFFVPTHNRSLSADDMMQAITLEMRHFESIFLTLSSKIVDHRVNYLTSPLEYIDNLSYEGDLEGNIGKVGSSSTLELSRVRNDHGAAVNISLGQIIHININGKLKFSSANRIMEYLEILYCLGSKEITQFYLQRKLS